jgi:hypothetical protein
MERIKHYTDMEARYRKQADTEPAKRERHLADADAWRRLLDTANLVVAKRSEMKEVLASFDKLKNGSGVG